MSILRMASEWLTLILGVLGLLWAVAQMSCWAVDAICTAFRVHRYFLQFVWQRERERRLKKQYGNDEAH